MLRLPALLGIVAPVPGLQRAGDAVGVQQGGQLGRVRLRRRPGGCPDLHQQIAHGVGRARHLGFQLVVGEAVVAQQGRAFGPQGQRFRRQRAVVGGAAVHAARGPGGIGALPQVAAGRELQEGHDQRPRQGDDRSTVTARLARRAGGVDDEIRQAGQVILRQRHEPVAFVRQQVLREFGPQHRQPRLHRRQPVGGGPLQLRPLPHEAAPGQHQHAGLFVGQVQIVAALPQILDPGKERGIGRDL